jgi:O-antigen/teichoic acid export membrane protein
VLEHAVGILLLGFIPLTVGGTVLSGSLVKSLLPPDYHDSGFLLALGIWRAPLLSLAFLYQSALIAMNRESAGLRLLLGGAVASGPSISIFLWLFGLPGACVSVLLIGLVLAVAGYACLVGERRAPTTLRQLLKPMLGATVMVPFCLWLERFHVVAAILGGAVVYLAVILALGVRKDLGLFWPKPATVPQCDSTRAVRPG